MAGIRFLFTLLIASNFIWALTEAAAAVAALPQYVSHKSCNGMKAGTFVAHPTNCNQYIRCNGLRSVLGDCPPETYFNDQILSCDKNRQACKLYQTKSTTTTITTTTTEATTTTTTSRPTTTQRPTTTKANTIFSTSSLSSSSSQSGSLGRPVCTPWYDQQFPHPYNCEYYYYCIRGYLTVRRCSYGLAWDLDREQCVPVREANCFKNFFLPTSQINL